MTMKPPRTFESLKTARPLGRKPIAPAPGAAQKVHPLTVEIFPVSIRFAHGKGSAVPRQRERNGAADILAGARNERDLALQGL